MNIIQHNLWSFRHFYRFLFLRRQKSFNFAIKFWGQIFSSSLERSDVSYPPMIETINLLEPSADFLAPGDRIHQVDGVSTVGLTNDQVMNLLLCNRDENAVIEIEYSLPDYRELCCEVINYRSDLNIFLIIKNSFAKQSLRHDEIGTGCGGAWKWMSGLNATWRVRDADHRYQRSRLRPCLQNKSHQTWWPSAARW